MIQWKDRSAGHGKTELILALNQSAAALHRIIERQRWLLATIAKIEPEACGLLAVLGCEVRRPSQAALKKAVGEAIEVPEESRKAFKCKKLWGGGRDILYVI